MIIACEKCATSYLLEDRLVPPGGATVQCTRCDHVFIAYPQQSAPPPPAEQNLHPAFPSGQEPPRSKTMIFGAAVARHEPAAAPPPQQDLHAAFSPEAARAKTMMFGSVSREPQPPGVTPPPQQELHPAFSPEAARAKTMMFGAVAPQSPAATPSATEDAEPPAPMPDRGGTKIFGRPPAADPSLAKTVIRTGPAGPEAQQPPSAAPTPTHGSQPGPSLAERWMQAPATRSEPPGIDPSYRQTLIVHPPQSPPAAGGGIKETAPELPSLKRKLTAARIDLPPEPLAVGGRSHESDDPAEQFQKQIRRRNRIALLAVIGVVLLIASALVARLVMKRLPAVPAAAVQVQDASLAMLRKDDSASKRQAIEQLGDLTRKYPAYFEGKAALVVALSLEFDDARIEIKRLNSRSEALHKEVARLKERQTPSDWQARANALIDQIAAIKQQQDPLVDALQKLDGELNAAFKSLAAAGELSAEANLALVRAQAVYYGVKGSDQAIAMSERYRLLRPEQDDGWGAVAFAEYAINSRVAPDTLKQALDGVEAVRKRDSTFLRTYTLAARLAIAQKRYSAALDELDAVLLLNPEHDVAKRLRDWVKELERAENKTAAPESP